MLTPKALFPVLAVALILLSACSSASSTEGSADTTSVASLATPATAGPAATKPAAAERPLVRSDTSEAERARMYRVYLSCLKANGLPRSAVKGTWENGGVSEDTATQYAKQCGSKKPQEEFDKARTSDPDFADHLRADVKCLNDNGIPVKITADGKDFGGDELPPEDKAHWLDDCEQQAFSGYYKSLN